MHTSVTLWVHRGVHQSELFALLAKLGKILETHGLKYTVREADIPPNWLRVRGGVFHGAQVEFHCDITTRTEQIAHQELIVELMASGIAGISTQTTIYPSTLEQVTALCTKTDSEQRLAGLELPYDGDLTQFPISELGLENRVTFKLARLEIKTVAQLICRSEPQIRAIHGIGPGALRQIHHRLAKYGLALLDVNGMMIELLELEVRQYNLLNRAGIQTVAELVGLRASALLAKPHFEESDIELISEALDKLNLKLADELPAPPEGFESIAIEELELGVRCYNVLKRAGIQTVGDLVQRSEAQLRSLPNFSQRSLDEVKESLAARNLQLREDN